MTIDLELREDYVVLTSKGRRNSRDSYDKSGGAMFSLPYTGNPIPFSRSNRVASSIGGTEHGIQKVDRY